MSSVQRLAHVEVVALSVDCRTIQVADLLLPTSPSLNAFGAALAGADLGLGHGLGGMVPGSVSAESLLNDFTEPR